MYIAKYFTKIYICLGSKIPHGKKRAKRASKKRIRRKKKKYIENKKNNKIIIIKKLSS